MTPLEQMKALAASARSRQAAFGKDAAEYAKKARVAELEAEEFERAAAILEAAK